MNINVLFRFFLTINATSLLIVVYLVQKGQSVLGLPNPLAYLIYFFIPVGLIGLSLIVSTKLGSDEFKKGSIISIEYANNSFLPSYLGYFFVALGIGSYETLAFVFSVLFIFTFLSQALYFNPLFLIFGYKFYNIRTKNGVSLFLISRYDYKRPNDIEIAKARRVNNYTFIEYG